MLFYKKNKSEPIGTHPEGWLLLLFFSRPTLNLQPLAGGTSRPWLDEDGKLIYFSSALQRTCLNRQHNRFTDALPPSRSPLLPAADLFTRPATIKRGTPAGGW